MSKDLITKELLTEEYLVNRYSIKKIAEKYGTTDSLIESRYVYSKFVLAG